MLSEKYLYFNIWSLFLPCPGNKEPCWKFSGTIGVNDRGMKEIEPRLTLIDKAKLKIVYQFQHEEELEWGQIDF